jgi:hypothetical protein
MKKAGPARRSAPLQPTPASRHRCSVTTRTIRQRMNGPTERWVRTTASSTPSRRRLVAGRCGRPLPVCNAEPAHVHEAGSALLRRNGDARRLAHRAEGAEADARGGRVSRSPVRRERFPRLAMDGYRRPGARGTRSRGRPRLSAPAGTCSGSIAPGSSAAGGDRILGLTSSGGVSNVLPNTCS